MSREGGRGIMRGLKILLEVLVGCIHGLEMGFSAKAGSTSLTLNH